MIIICPCGEKKFEVDSNLIPESLDGLVYCPGSVNLRPFRGLKPETFIEDFNLNVMGAIKMAKELGPGNTIVTILCDDANKYYEKMFNKNFLNDNNLPIPDWL